MLCSLLNILAHHLWVQFSKSTLLYFSLYITDCALHSSLLMCKTWELGKYVSRLFSSSSKVHTLTTHKYWHSLYIYKSFSPFLVPLAISCHFLATLYPPCYLLIPSQSPDPLAISWSPDNLLIPCQSPDPIDISWSAGNFLIPWQSPAPYGHLLITWPSPDTLAIS